MKLMTPDDIKRIERIYSAKFYRNRDNKYYFVHILIVDDIINPPVIIYEIDIKENTCVRYTSSKRFKKDDITGSYELDVFCSLLKD